MPEPYGISFFCDDVRVEQGGKYSYMGIYGNDMAIEGEKPATLPKFVIAVHMLIPAAMALGRMKVVVFQEVGERSEELISLEGELNSPQDLQLGDEHLIAANFHLNAVPFIIEESCVLKVMAFLGEEQQTEVRMGALRINFTEPPAQLEAMD